MKTSDINFVLKRTNTKTVLFTLCDIDRIPSNIDSREIINKVDSFLESSLRQLQVLRFKYVNGTI